MLIDAAGHLLTKGQPLTFESLAEATGVSGTLPYKYFSSIDQLVTELYDRVVVAADDGTEALLAADISFDEKVGGTWRIWADAIREDGMLLLAMVDGVSIPSLKSKLDRRRERTVARWAGVIEIEFAVDHRHAMLVAASTTAASSALHVRWIQDRLRAREVEAMFVRLVRAQCEAITGLQPERSS